MQTTLEYAIALPTVQPSIDPLTNTVVTPAAFVAPVGCTEYLLMRISMYPDARAIGVLRFNAYAIGYNDAIRVTCPSSPRASVCHAK